MSHIRVLGDRNPDYVTHRELDAALALFPAGARAHWMASDAPGASSLHDIDGLWVAPGSPYRNDDAVLAAIRAAREERVPFLATCGGFQYAALELARDVAGIASAQHAEVAPDAKEPVIAPLACALLGKLAPVRPVPGTTLARILGDQQFDGYHWCSFGVTASWLPRLRAAGLVESAHGETGGLEGFELPGHPFFIATAFQPQVGASSSRTLSPLIAALLEAASVRARTRSR